MKIKTVYENKRGCGYRKPGGLYLRSDALAVNCGLLPVPLEVCTRCGSGIKPSRGFTWVDADLVTSNHCRLERTDHCKNICGLRSITGRCGLLWIGEKYYPAPQKFSNECGAMGVSRRIKSVPNGFVVGKTWVFVAHRKCIMRDLEGKQTHIDGEFIPGIFQAFQPQRIEYVVKGTETEKELEDLVKRGIDLVDVKPVNDKPKLFDGDEN